VEDQRHSLDQGLVGADHAVEPPEVVVPPGVGGGERVAVVVPRRRPAEGGGPARPGQRLDRGDKAERDELVGLAGGRAEAGTLQQANRLRVTEGTLEGAGRPGIECRRGDGRGGGGCPRFGLWRWRTT
jgi:hypothetical protein